MIPAVVREVQRVPDCGACRVPLRRRRLYRTGAEGKAPEWRCVRCLPPLLKSLPTPTLVLRHRRR